jgi:hypothetical protein
VRSKAISPTLVLSNLLRVYEVVDLTNSTLRKSRIRSFVLTSTRAPSFSYCSRCTTKQSSNHFFKTPHNIRLRLKTGKIPSRPAPFLHSTCPFSFFQKNLGAGRFMGRTAAGAGPETGRLHPGQILGIPYLVRVDPDLTRG